MSYTWTCPRCPYPSPYRRLFARSDTQIHLCQGQLVYIIKRSILLKLLTKFSGKKTAVIPKLYLYLYSSQMTFELLNQGRFKHSRAIWFRCHVHNYHIAPLISRWCIAIYRICPSPKRVVGKTNLKDHRRMFRKQTLDFCNSMGQHNTSHCFYWWKLERYAPQTVALIKDVSESGYVSLVRQQTIVWW